ncbi:MAG: hypothetical protein ILP07_12495 [Treponema sp.]|jgi:hypothetical protein|nr:hypothetical protein [Treponema sp.]
MENEDSEALKKLWPVLCALICVAGGMIFSSRVWGRTNLSLLSILINVGLAGLGAVIGLITFKLGKKAKIAALVFCLLILGTSLGLSKYMTSDAYIVKQDWPVHELDTLTFAYPTTLKEKNLKGVEPENADAKVLTNENMNRYVACYIYDFKRDKPSLEACVESAVTTILTRYGAKTLIWDTDTTTISPSVVKGRFTFTNKLRNKTYTHTGFAYGHAEGAHYEIIMFYPLRKQYSEAFMNKIEESIELKTER